MNGHGDSTKPRSGLRCFVSGSLVAVSLGLSVSAWADSARRGKGQTTASAAQTKPHKGYRQEGAYRPKGRAHQPKVTAAQEGRFGNYYQHVAGGFGSASNVPPGFYDDLYPPQRPGRIGSPVVLQPVLTIPLTPNPTIVIENNVAPPQVVYIERPVPADPPAEIVPRRPAPAPAPAVNREPSPPRSREPGELIFQVQPATAQVYLDEDFLGSGAEVSQQDPVSLRAAVYVLEVTHPEHDSERLFFGVDAHSTQRIEVDLTASRATQRVRVRELK